MADEPVVYTDINPNGTSNGTTGTLFEGKKFWLSHNVPQRSRFKELIQMNGGIVVLQEKDADIKLVDHTKREIPLNTYSYQYVEKSIRNGRLENLEDHRAGKTTRPVGAYGIPSRSRRVPFSLEDDQIVWDWMQPYEVSGAAVSGNVIYEQLAEKYPRHTMQSWRTRYLKHLRGRPRPGGPPPPGRHANPENESPTDDICNNLTVPADTVRRSSRLHTETSNGAQNGVENLPPSGRERGGADVSPSRSITRPARSPQRTPEVTSARQVASPVVKFRDSLLAELQTPDIPDRRATISTPTNLNGQMGASHSTSIRTATLPESTKKRRREDDLAIPTFDADDLTNRKRRATDYIPRTLPSTPDQSHPVKRKTAHEALHDSTSDETDAETAPRRQPTLRKTPARPQADALMTEEEMNLNAFMELPFPPLPSDSEDLESTTKDDSRDKVVHDMDEWIEEHVRRLGTDRATSERLIITALRCTTMDPELADRVLEHLAAGKGIPQHMRGVWTAEDDACLEGTDARNIDRLLKKHGTELYNARFEYLEMVRAAGLKA
ncbi:hypothetical protein VTN77DRAFT_3712 [Rasamsonia byssochlamydoides]|uniref:uncharacterized protein n=1 Tax=Rasamsonia byssochlamydoides TaxID=89139 RepID=UPI003744700C